MKPKKEMIQARIPEGNEWGASELEAKAEELGLNKSELIIKAVDFFINLDTDTYEKMVAAANGLHIPLWLYMQNKIIKDMAQTRVEFEKGISDSKLVNEFMMMEYPEGTKVLTGVELYKSLKEFYTLLYKKNNK